MSDCALGLEILGQDEKLDIRYVDEDSSASAFDNHRRNNNAEDDRLEYAAATEEWDQVATIEPLPQGVDNVAVQSQTSPSITVHEAIEYFKGIDLTEHICNVNSVVERKGFCTLFSCFLGPPQLYDQLTPERDLVFAITKCDWIAENSIHWRMLQTVYKQFTGDVLDCPRFGSHWQTIGFQGSDPGTDFRAVGMLGLLHLLYFTTTSQYKQFASNLYKTSLDENQNFPLAVLSLNITCIALQALRHGELNRECNQRRQVFQVFNEFYAAVLYHFSNIYMTQNKTIKDTGYLLKEVEWFCRSNVKDTLRNLQNHVINTQVQQSTRNVNETTDLDHGNFQDVLLRT